MTHMVHHQVKNVISTRRFMPWVGISWAAMLVVAATASAVSIPHFVDPSNYPSDVTGSPFAPAVTCSTTGAKKGTGAAAPPGLTSVNGRAGPTPVPVPEAAWLFGSGLIGLAAVAWRRTPDKIMDAAPRALKLVHDVTRSHNRLSPIQKSRCHASRYCIPPYAKSPRSPMRLSMLLRLKVYDAGEPAKTNPTPQRNGRSRSNADAFKE